MDSNVPVQKKKTSEESERSLLKFLEPSRKPKVIYTHNSLEFGKACEDLSWNHCTSTLTIQKRMGLLREQYAELKKGHLLYFCKQVWMKIGGRIPWDATAIRETYKIACLMGKQRSKVDLENHLKDRSFHLVHWLKIILYPQKTSDESINLVSKYSLEYSSVVYCTREESGIGSYWLWTLRCWKRWMHQKPMLKDSTRKRRKCLTVDKCSYSPSQMEQ